jgi:Ran GTPase-activating protein (RanGAP) involved in mRNA processing and transport
MSSSGTPDIPKTSILDDIPLDLMHDIFAYMKHDQYEIADMITPLSPRMKNLVETDFFHTWMFEQNKNRSCAFELNDYDNIIELMTNDGHGQQPIQICLNHHRLLRDDTKLMNIIQKLKTNVNVRSLILNNKNIKEHQLRTLATILVKNTTLHYLNLNGNDFTDRSYEYIADIMKKNTTIRSLNIPLNPASLLRFADIMQNNTSIREFTIDCRKNTEEAISPFIRSLAHHPSIRCLDIKFNSKFNQNTVNALCEMIDTTSTLHTLKTDIWISKDSGLVLTDIERLARSLGQNQTIRNLVFSYSLNNDNIRIIVDALKTNHTLLELHFSGMKITHLSEPFIGDLLYHNQTLTTFSIPNSIIFRNGATNVCNALRTNTRIRNLNFYSPGMNTEAALQFAEILQMNTTIQSLDIECIDYDNVEELGMTALINALKVNRGIRHLNMSGCRSRLSNNLCKPVITRICEIVAENTTLLSLNIDNCDVDTNFGILMGSAVRRNTTLTELNINFDHDFVYDGLYEGLMENTTIKKLSVEVSVYNFGDAPGDPSYMKITDYILRNTSLETIIFNNFGDDIADALIANTRIRYLQSYVIEEANMSQLLRILQNNPRIKLLNQPNGNFMHSNHDLIRQIESIMFTRC